MSMPNLLFLATTDSYLKWAAGLQASISHKWPSKLFIVKSLQNPSRRQIDLALGVNGATELESIHLLSAIRWILKNTPDAVVVAATGPFVVVLRWMLSFTSKGKRIRLISGSPGVAYHLIGTPLKARLECDLILVASKRELNRIGHAARQTNETTSVALATLPFLKGITPERYEGPDQIILAPQPDMPKSKENRQLLLKKLAQVADELGIPEVLVKVRATKGEPQTHFEAFPYEDLFEEMVARGEISNSRFKFVLGSVTEYLMNKNASLISVSSTAALESIAMGNATHLISDFGVNDEIATEVFSGSGMLHPIASHAKARQSRPNPDWLEDNYFHDPELDDWQQAVVDLMKRTTIWRFRLLPNSISKSLFLGEFLRVVFPNRLGRWLISSIKLILQK